MMLTTFGLKRLPLVFALTCVVNLACTPDGDTGEDAAGTLSTPSTSGQSLGGTDAVTTAGAFGRSAGSVTTDQAMSSVDETGSNTEMAGGNTVGPAAGPDTLSGGPISGASEPSSGTTPAGTTTEASDDQSVGGVMVAGESTQVGGRAAVFGGLAMGPGASGQVTGGRYNSDGGEDAGGSFFSDVVGGYVEQVEPRGGLDSGGTIGHGNGGRTASHAGSSGPPVGGQAIRGGMPSAGLAAGGGRQSATAGVDQASGGIPEMAGQSDLASGGHNDAASDYPQAPYGVRVGDTIEDLQFIHYSSGALALSDIRQQPGVRLIALVTTAMWCGVCMRKMPGLATNQTTYEDAGVYVAAAVYHDRSFNPADALDARQIRQQYAPELRVLADPEPTLEPYFQPFGRDKTILIDAATMTIVSLRGTFTNEQLANDIQRWLDGN